ncbi:cysteine--tRNA ligase [Tateyamaria armeniaca]|uniref:Cysteine--tRNA ligase n=1 Tax=Tateyamaria armeniaca TaxID=2518930 RepID=A0ABW8UY58_9RHOB
MTITLYNTATRRKEPFEPLDPENVRMYVCGPTVYDRAHLGNARPVLVFDVLYRLLRHTYGADHVTYVRNFTDVDDKINATALARKEAGAAGSIEDLVRERSDETIAWYRGDMDALGALRPTHEPRATEYIDQMVAMIAQLVADGFAYEKDGHVLFRVRKYAKYGELSGRSVDDMIAGARVEVAPYKEDPMDFVLWKPSSDDLPGWDSPWGRGRPGWHIECSAMAYELLGDRFDIHGGGNDLQFPHHENEIAQSKCAGHGFANVWMHNEMLQVEGKKMSKSLGNFFTVRELLDQGFLGEVIRFVMLSTHYRKPMDWTAEKADRVERKLLGWWTEISRYADLGSLEDLTVSSSVTEALSNDLNTHLALSKIDEMANNEILGNERFRQLAVDLEFLGLLNADFATMTRFGFIDRKSSIDADLQLLLNTWIEKRADAKRRKEFARADYIRDALQKAGVSLKDEPNGTRWEITKDFDPSKLEALK